MSRWLHSLRQGWATIPAAHHSPARWMLPRSNLSCNAGLRFNTMCCLNCVRRESTAPDGLQKTRESERAECGPVQTEGGRLHEHVGALPGATIAGKDVRGRALGLQQATRARLSQRFARPPSISHGRTILVRICRDCATAPQRHFYFRSRAPHGFLGCYKTSFDII